MPVPATIRNRDGAELSYRPLAPGDAPLLTRFHDSLSPASVRHFTPHGYDTDLLEHYIDRTESGDDLSFILVDSTGDIVAYFFLWEFTAPIPALGIGITDAYQSQKIGPQLMDILIDQARQADRHGIELTTFPDNERAFALYRSKGFEYVGDVENVTGDGRTVIEKKMFLPLKDGATPTDRNFQPPV